MNLTLHLAICGILLLILVASFLYRKFIDDHDDHNIHLSGNTTDVRVINTQVEHAKRIEMLDKLNKVLLVVVVAYLIVIGVLAAYISWSASPGLQ
jgi:flagellar biogenesis protein FliO